MEDKTLNKIVGMMVGSMFLIVIGFMFIGIHLIENLLIASYFIMSSIPISVVIALLIFSQRYKIAQQFQISVKN